MRVYHFTSLQHALNRKRMQEEAGIICFCKRYQRPILWSHYADKHRGVCLGFDASAEHADEVKYVKERIPLISSDGKAVDPAAFESLFISKDADWAYEEEVRVHVVLDRVDAIEDGHRFLRFKPGLELREVLLGDRCPMPVETMRDLVQRTHIGVTVRKTGLAFKWFAVVALD